MTLPRAVYGRRYTALYLAFRGAVSKKRHNLPHLSVQYTVQGSGFGPSPSPLTSTSPITDASSSSSSSSRNRTPPVSSTHTQPVHQPAARSFEFLPAASAVAGLRIASRRRGAILMWQRASAPCRPASHTNTLCRVHVEARIDALPGQRPASARPARTCIEPRASSPGRSCGAHQQVCPVRDGSTVRP